MIERRCNDQCAHPTSNAGRVSCRLDNIGRGARKPAGSCRRPDLSDRLAQTGLFPGVRPVEGNSWRPGAFRRFLLGNLADGQEEWLEFWHSNHLLAPFSELAARRETGTCGGRDVPFLSLPDLIRSKETERAKDWDDVSYLEEFLDARLHARCVDGRATVAEALAQVRSRRGFDTYVAENRFADALAVRRALERTTNSVTQAFLLPWTRDAIAAPPVVAMEPLIERKLRAVAPASPLHRSLVEVVRRQYKSFCQDRDRADKETIRLAQGDAK